MLCDHCEADIPRDAPVYRDSRQRCSCSSPCLVARQMEEATGELFEVRAAAGDPHFDRWEPPERETSEDRGDGYGHGDKATWR